MAYNLVVSTSQNYMPGIKAFLRSFFHYHPEGDRSIQVHLLCYRDVQKDQLAEFDGRIKFVDTWNDHKLKACKIERFAYANTLDGVVGVFDGDMFFLDSMLPYFRIVEKTGYIVCGLNGSNIMFTESYSEKFGENINGLFNWRTVTSVPTIMQIEKYGHIWQRIHDHIMETYTLGDFVMLNILLAHYGLLDQVIGIPAQIVTNIHHFMLKPNTRVIEKGGQIITEDGQKVLMTHGRWWDKKYTDNLVTTMERFAKGNEQIVAGARASRDLLLRIFESWGDQENGADSGNSGK